MKTRQSSPEEERSENAKIKTSVKAGVSLTVTSREPSITATFYSVLASPHGAHL